MKHVTLLFIVSLCLISPVRAQSRLYTNADLGKPLVRTTTPTAEEMQGLVARQFRLTQRASGPRAIVLPYDPSWPFTYAQRLEPDPWRTPGVWSPYGAWPYYGGYAVNPFATFPAPCAFGACHASKRQVRGATSGAVDRHRRRVTPR